MMKHGQYYLFKCLFSLSPVEKGDFFAKLFKLNQLIQAFYSVWHCRLVLTKLTKLMILKFILVTYWGVIARMTQWDICFFFLWCQPIQIWPNISSDSSLIKWEGWWFSLRDVIIRTNPSMQLLSGLPPPLIARGQSEYTPSVDGPVMAMVTKSSLWLLLSPGSEGWHLFLRPWLSQCRGQYLTQPWSCTCKDRHLAQRNTTLQWLSEESNKERLI